MVVADRRQPMAVRISKDGDARFMGHLDFARLVLRSLRRSGLPVRSSQGFNPKLKVAFAEALPVGVGSTGEWITVVMNEDLPSEEVRARLAPALPESVRLVDVRRGAPPARAGPVRYRLDLVSGVESATDALDALLLRTEYMVTDPRRDEPIDVRAGIASGSARGDHLLVDLTNVDGRPPRPGPVVQALRELAEEAGDVVPVFGAVTKCAEAERRHGDDEWPDGVVAGGASSSSTRSSPRRVASRSSRAVGSRSTT